MSKAIGVVKPSSESVGAAGHQPSPQIRKLTKLIDAQRQSKRLPTRRPPSMIISHGRLVSSRLSRRSHPDCRATYVAFNGQFAALEGTNRATRHINADAT